MELLGDSARGAEWAAVRLHVEGDRIVDADADGLAHDLRGLTLLEAAAVGGETLPVDALANALAPAVSAAPDPSRVAVAMSGGVDSAVTLLRFGPSAVGVTLRLWLDPDGPDSERACCSPSAVIAARTLCHSRGLPHVTLDLREEFRRAVVGPFVRGYARGETPNPCIRCNGGFRFAELLAFARRIGAARLATGHYARIVERDGVTLLARAADPAKDQSYMLARLDPRRLARVSFPLGTQTKSETRAEAFAAGLAAAGRAESQEACFLAGGDYRAFLERHGLASAPGVLVDEAGAELGVHGGFWRFTPGQRRGLGVAAPEPLYALETNARANTVTVGPREALARRTVTVRGRLFAPAANVEAKLRYRSPAVAASVEETATGFRLHLDEPAYGVARGQAAVLYDGDVVVGSGLVTSATRLG
jgi:tRNA-specific 2-thiouridylase